MEDKDKYVLLGIGLLAAYLLYRKSVEARAEVPAPTPPAVTALEPKKVVLVKEDGRYNCYFVFDSEGLNVVREYPPTGYGWSKCVEDLNTMLQQVAPTPAVPTAPAPEPVPPAPAVTPAVQPEAVITPTTPVTTTGVTYEQYIETLTKAIASEACFDGCRQLSQQCHESCQNQCCTPTSWGGYACETDCWERCRQTCIDRYYECISRC